MEKENKEGLPVGTGQVGTGLTGTGEAPLVTPAPTPEPKPRATASGNKKEKTDEEMVTVSAKTLQSILSKIEVLEKAADRGRFEKANSEKNPQKITKSVNLATYQGRIVSGWRILRDDVWFDHEGKLHEDQIVALFFHKGKKDENGVPVPEKELNVQSFARLLKRLPAEVIEESKDRNGNINLTVITKEGEEIKIDNNFVNAV